VAAAEAQRGARVPAPDAAERGTPGWFERRLVALMAARLALALLSLGIALAVDTAVDLGIEDWRGLYGTVALAFVATALYGVVLPRVRRRRRFAAVNVATDIGMVSALVYFSGNADTVFAFLYLLVAVYGALLFERRGALAVAALAALAYAGVLVLGRALGPVPDSAAALPRALLVGTWAVHSLATLAAAALASVLSAELRRTGEALRQRTHDLDRLWRLHRHTVESLMSGLLTIDPEGRITSFNPEAERITGLRAHQALGRDVDEVLPGVRGEAIARAGAAGGARARVRLAYRSSRGGSYLGVGAYVLRDDEGRPSGHVVIFQDVTEVVEMERELRRSERLAAVGQLSASMAHEIRNPLAAISGAIQVLGRGGEGRRAREESRRLMEIVLRETDRLNRLLTEFLEYARPGPLRLEALPLAEAVAEVLAIFDASRPGGVEVSVDLEPGLSLRADPGQLRQVLWNLLLNAAQAMPGGGTIALGARAVGPQDGPAGRRNDREEGGWVEIAVRDAGVGIPAEALERIFDPFFTTKPGGTGLGLATVHRIVEEHGGSIRVQSAEGKGTTFQLRLPRVAEAR
jgi:two-component system sensor histidine kinase PilS (NtrC family)